MTIIRNKNTPIIVERNIINDSRLSLSSIGFLVLFASFNKGDHFEVESFINKYSEAKNTIEELIKYKYIKKIPVLGKFGEIIDIEYQINQIPYDEVNNANMS